MKFVSFSTTPNFLNHCTLFHSLNHSQIKNALTQSSKRKVAKRHGHVAPNSKALEGSEAVCGNAQAAKAGGEYENGNEEAEASGGDESKPPMSQGQG